MGRLVTAAAHWPDHANHEISYNVQVTEIRAITSLYMVGDEFSHVSIHDTIDADESDPDGDPYCEDCGVHLSWEGSDQEAVDLS